MKKIILACICVSLSINVFSQITVTDVNLFSVGDVIYLAEDQNTNINIGNALQNQIWDFSSLQNMNLSVLNALSVSGTPYDASYPNANICIEDDGDFIYIDKSSSGVYMLGIGDSVFQQSLMICPIPLSYGLSYTDGPLLVLDSVIGGNMVNTLLLSQGVSPLMITSGSAHVADSLSIQAEITTYFDVDADGTMILPMGSYDVVRLKSQRESEYNVNIYCIDTITGSGTGWYNVPSSVVPFLEPSTEVSYQWYSNNSVTKFSLAEVLVDDNGNPDGSVTFLTNNTTSILDTKKDYIHIYPVPSNSSIHISKMRADAMQAFLFDIHGNEIFRFVLKDSEDIDLSPLNKGIYFLRITSEDGKNLIKKIILE